MLAADGVVIRYGQFYGPGIDDAARLTLPALEAASGVITLVEG